MPTLFFAKEFTEYSTVKQSSGSIYDIKPSNIQEIKKQYKFQQDYEAYSMKILDTLKDLNKYQRKEFIIHQLDLVKDKKLWFYTLQDCIDEALKDDVLNFWPLWLKGIEEVMDQIYSEYISELKSSRITSKPKTSNKVTKSKLLSFELKNQYKEKIDEIINALAVNINFINDQLTSVDDAVQIFQSKDLSIESKQIHLNCELTDFRYLIDKIKHIFNSLTPAKIGQSKCFVSKEGTTINAQTLYSSKIYNPKQKETIDRVVKHYL